MDLRSRPLVERKRLLSDLLDGDVIRYTAHLITAGVRLCSDFIRAAVPPPRSDLEPSLRIRPCCLLLPLSLSPPWPTLLLVFCVSGDGMARFKTGHNWWTNDPSPQARGYRFQFSLTKRIMERLRGFRTVTFKDIHGNVLTPDNFARVGRDGGSDLVLEIKGASRAAAMQTAGKVKKKLKALGDEPPP